MRRLDMCMLNDYLNRYTEKLSRGNAFNSAEIKLDQLNYQSLQKGVEKRTFNPYMVF